MTPEYAIPVALLVFGCGITLGATVEYKQPTNLDPYSRPGDGILTGIGIIAFAIGGMILVYFIS